MTALKTFKTFVPEYVCCKCIEVFLNAGVYILLLLRAALPLLFIWNTAQLAHSTLTAMISHSCQVPTNTHRTHSNITLIAYSFCNSLWHQHPDCYASCQLIFLPCDYFASIYNSTAVKSYILNYMWTAANSISKAACVRTATGCAPLP